MKARRVSATALVLAVAGMACADEARLAIVHRTAVEPSGAFAYWIELPGVNPMPRPVVGLWSEMSGTFVLFLDPLVRLTRVQGFAATDIGSVFEGDLNLVSLQGRGLALFAPHKEQPFENRDAWGERRIDYTVPAHDTALYVKWVCRATGPSWDPLYHVPTGRVEARCHFGLSIDAVQP